MAFPVARIGAQKNPCVCPFQKWSLRASVFQSLKTFIWIRTLVFTTGFLQQRLALTANIVRVQVACHEKWFQSFVYSLIDKNWVTEPHWCCDTPVAKIKVLDVQIQMFVFSHHQSVAPHAMFMVPPRFYRPAWGTCVLPSPSSTRQWLCTARQRMLITWQPPVGKVMIESNHTKSN